MPDRYQRSSEHLVRSRSAPEYGFAIAEERGEARLGGNPVCQPLGPRGNLLLGEAHHAQSRNGIQTSLQIERDRRFQRGNRQLIHAQGAEQRILANPFERFALSDQDAGLRAAQQLVAAESDDIHARLQALAAGARRARQGSRSTRHPLPKSSRANKIMLLGQLHKLASVGRSVKPTMRKLLGCTRSSTRVRSLMAAA